MMIIKFDLIFSENLFSDKLNQSTHINFEYCCYTKTTWKMIENIIGHSNTNIFQLKKWTIILLWDTGRSEVIKPNQHLYRNKTTYFKYFVFCRLIFFLLFGSIANSEFGIEKCFFFSFGQAFCSLQNRRRTKSSFGNPDILFVSMIRSHIYQKLYILRVFMSSIYVFLLPVKKSRYILVSEMSILDNTE